MARLIKTKTEWEGNVQDEVSVVEGEEPSAWADDAVLRVAGKSTPRVDGAERVTGRARYTSDIQLPGMLYARVLRSPHARARVRSVDTAKARSLPGVRAVVTAAEAGDLAHNGVKAFEAVVRFVGDEVAAVAADSESIAQEAVDLIKVHYEALPFVLQGDAALSKGAPAIHASTNVVGQPRVYERGRVSVGFAEADVIVEETFRTQSALHNCMETHGAIASWSGDELTVWESTQSVFRTRDELAEVFHLSPDKVRVICEFMGGGFGSKQYPGKWSIIAALLARKAGRPVRLFYNRAEESLATGSRAPTIQHIKMGAKRDGSLSAIELDVVSGIGAYGHQSLFIEGPARVMYLCPNVHTEVRSAFTDTGPSRSFRGPGYVEGAFPLECAIDELAEQLGMDPLEMRMKNYVKGDRGTGRPYSAKHLDECYRRGAELIGWKRRKSAGGAGLTGRGTKRTGLGMASQTWGGGGGPPAYAWVRIDQHGRAAVITGSQDIGTGTRTVFAQIAAEELHVDPSEIAVQLGDTASGPYAPVSWGSMTVSSVGPAVRQAAIDAARQLRDICAGYLDVSPDEVELRDGKVYLRGQAQQRAAVSDITSEIGDFTILGKGARGANDASVEARTFGAQFAEVEVDIESGEVEVLKVVSTHDCGRVINPMGAANQVRGAVVQGIGYALTEGRVVDRRTGIVLNPNLEDYLVSTALDSRSIEYGFTDRADVRANSLGAKGLGEPAMIPTAPAIANALRNAIGVRFLSLPIDRASVLEGLRKQGAQRRGPAC